LRKEFITNRHPPYASRQFVAPSQKTPIHQDAGPDPRAHRYENNIPAIAGDTFPTFSHNESVAVTVYNDRERKMFAQSAAERKALPCTNVRRPDIAILIRNTRDIHSQRAHPLPRNLVEKLKNFVDHGGSALRGRDRFKMMTDASGVANSGNSDIRTAYIDCQHKIRHKTLPSPWPVSRALSANVYVPKLAATLL
jgi:hypothetical protein